MSNFDAVQKSLRRNASPQKARILQGFFKTGKGQYGEGDRFIGVTVPVIRHIAEQGFNLNYPDILKFLRSPIHEERLLAVILLVKKYQRGSDSERKTIFNLYIRNMAFINNWDLIDLSAPSIVGHYLFDKSPALLFRFAKSSGLWKRRVSVVAPFYFIRQGQYDLTLKIAALLLQDKQDLIHKAAGWMLREVGKRDLAAEEKFLKKHCRVMPRTMLRYAIERFPERKRKAYLRRKV